MVVCFNYGAYVEEAISSVLAQTAVGQCEVLVVDGGSEDPQTVEKMQPARREAATAHDGASTHRRTPSRRGQSQLSESSVRVVAT